MITVGGFDQGAEVGRQVRLGGGNQIGIAAAEADRDTAGGEDQFARRVFAQNPDNRTPRRLAGLRVIEAVLNHPATPGLGIRGFTRTAHAGATIASAPPVVQRKKKGLWGKRANATISLFWPPTIPDRK